MICDKADLDVVGAKHSHSVGTAQILSRPKCGPALHSPTILAKRRSTLPRTISLVCLFIVDLVDHGSACGLRDRNQRISGIFANASKRLASSEWWSQRPPGCMVHGLLTCQRPGLAAHVQAATF